MRCSQFQQKLVECEEATKGLEMDLRAERLRTSSEENIRALKESNSLQQAAYNRCDELSSALEELRSKHERTSATVRKHVFSENNNSLLYRVLQLSELAHENKQLVKQIGSLKKNCRQNEDNLVQLSDAKAEAMAACEELLAMGFVKDGHKDRLIKV
uniref:Uncharacterized protein n=1 Tax=Spongospora subterranea TaxID=70186 RepID=A0A0H5QI65_9EUKA|eukprot:CRZ01688.1 hypothetical protein [Spongospora subterranea]